jgi:cell division inhibitor SulA
MSASIADIVALASTQILSDIEAGMIPECVSSFSELHDYVDANTYGDPLVAELEKAGERWLDIVLPVQNLLDQWLSAGRPANVLPVSPTVVRETVREASTDLMEGRAAWHAAVEIGDDVTRLQALRRVLRAERILLPMQRAL